MLWSVSFLCKMLKLKWKVSSLRAFWEWAHARGEGVVTLDQLLLFSVVGGQLHLSIHAAPHPRGPKAYPCPSHSQPFISSNMLALMALSHCPAASSKFQSPFLGPPQEACSFPRSLPPMLLAPIFNFSHQKPSESCLLWLPWQNKSNAFRCADKRQTHSKGIYIGNNNTGVLSC